MAVIVKRQGSTQAVDLEYIGYCQVCGEIFRYKYSDLDQNPISTYHEMAIKCPICSRWIAFSNTPIEILDITVKANEPFIANKEVIVPSGVNVYGVFKNGPVLFLQKYEWIVPAGVPMIFMTDQSQIEVVDLPQLRVYPKDYSVAYLTKVTEDNYKEFYTISKRFNIIHLKELPETGLGIWMESAPTVVQKQPNLHVELGTSQILEGETTTITYSSDNPDGVYTVTALDPSIATVSEDVITGVTPGTAKFKISINEDEEFFSQAIIVELKVSTAYQVLVNDTPQNFQVGDPAEDYAVNV